MEALWEAGSTRSGGSSNGSRCPTYFQGISRDSTPGWGYYALISAAALIASLGLVANSAAVVIGAMLVSPLMSPIFGMALGMIRGEPGLLGRSVRAEITGVILAVFFGALFGALPVLTEVTPEMLARTEPTLLDLLVAVFAGLAGTLAVLDERISPALPGVAISTAIVPPLATCGLCLSAGAFHGAYGAFLLFFANFLAILLVSSLAFLVSGMGLHSESHIRQLKKRMFIAVAGFVLVFAYLTHALVLMVQDRREKMIIGDVIETALASHSSASLVNVAYKEIGGDFNVLATIRTPKPFTPDQVKAVQDKLDQALGLNVSLVAHCILAKDISPTGSARVVINPTLDGKFISENVPPDIKRIQLAEQTLREELSARPELLLLDIDLVHILGDPVIVASIQSSRPLVPFEVRQFERAIQDRLGDPGIKLLARCQVSQDVAADGRILYGSAHFGPQPEIAGKIKDRASKSIEDSGEFFVTAMDVVKHGDVWDVRAEVAGTRVIMPKELAEIEKSVAGWLGEKIKLVVWTKTELMAQSNGLMPVEEFARRRLIEAGARKEGGVPDPGKDVPAAAPAPDGVAAPAPDSASAPANGS